MTRDITVGAVELGGSHGVLWVGRSPDDLDLAVEFDNDGPEATLGAIRRALSPHLPRLAWLGIGSFGPVSPTTSHAPGGRIGPSPKEAWRGLDLLEALDLPDGLGVSVDTDVNCAALGEVRWGAGQGCRNLVYLTVGTGIGGGAMVDGACLHGALHPEMGHLRLPRHPDDAAFAGVCPAHGACWEGLASAPALAARVGMDPADLPDDHALWSVEAWYLAQGLLALALVLCPERIVVGGGVLRRRGLLEGLRREFAAALGDYRYCGPLQAPVEDYLVAPGLGGVAGVAGAMALAGDAALRSPGP